MLMCAFCGYQNKREGRFCTSCGNRLAEDSYVVARLVLLADDERQKEYLVADAERIIGRDRGNDIVVEDEEASARHARVTYENDAFWIEDLDTTNGTFVNGEALTGKHCLENEDLVKVGRTLLQFRL